jgi:hypothetical protein
VNAIQILYRADITATSAPVLRIGWLDDTLNEDDAEKCLLPVPIEIGRNAMVSVSLASSLLDIRWELA